MKTLVIVAACNEGPSLEHFLPRLSKVRRFVDHDVVLVNDGSSDNTARIASDLGCKVISNRENRGIGFSLRRGYVYADRNGYDFIATMDADGQHDPEVLIRMQESLHKAEAEIVKASRYHPDSERVDVPLDRDLLNISVTAQVNAVTGWNITDPLCGFWLMKKKVIRHALRFGKQERYGIHLEHLIKFWYLVRPRPKLIEVPHPAIYGNHGDGPLLTREYSPSNRELRIDRFGTHAEHLVQALSDVEKLLPNKIAKAISESRR